MVFRCVIVRLYNINCKNHCYGEIIVIAIIFSFTPFLTVPTEAKRSKSAEYEHTDVHSGTEKNYNICKRWYYAQIPYGFLRPCHLLSVAFPRYFLQPRYVLPYSKTKIFTFKFILFYSKVAKQSQSIQIRIEYGITQIFRIFPPCYERAM